MMADDGLRGDSTHDAGDAAAIRSKLQSVWRQNRGARHTNATPKWLCTAAAGISSSDPERDATPKWLCTAAAGISPSNPERDDTIRCGSSHASSVGHIRASQSARRLPCCTSQVVRCRQHALPTVCLSTSSRKHHVVCVRRTYSAAPRLKYRERIDYAEVSPWGYSEWPPFSRPFLLECHQVHSRRWDSEGTSAANPKKTATTKAVQRQKHHPCLTECATVPCSLDSRKHKCRRERLSQKAFFCLLTLAALLCSLFCLFLLRHKEGNPLTQVLMLYARSKETAVQQMRSMISLYKDESATLFGSQLLRKLLLQVATSWFCIPRISARLTYGTAVSDGGEPAAVGQRLKAVEGDFEAAERAIRAPGARSYAHGPSVSRKRVVANLAFDGGHRAPLHGGEDVDFEQPTPFPTSPYVDENHRSDIEVEDEGAFLDSLTKDELRDLILAEGGWTYIPHTRHNPPIELPDSLPPLPRPGGGRFLRRQHPPDSPPLFPGQIPGITVGQVLRNGRQLLTAETYREAASALQYAVRDGHLTRAVRLHGQFLYPWKLFSDGEREALRLLADQVRWFPKWVKHHRRSQRVDKSVLDLYLPVVVPQFVDNYGGPGSPSLDLTQGIRFTWLGHAASLVNIDGLQVLLDPMFDHDLIGSYNEWLRSLVLYVNALCGSLGGRHRAPPCPYEELPADIDVVILSHNHQDHIMENDVETLCRRLSDRFKKLIWYVPEGVAAFLRQYGCASSSIFEFSWGETRTLSCHTRAHRRICIDGVWKKHRTLVETYEITFAAGLHWSGRRASKTDHNASLWGGYAINGPRHKFFYAGDTAYWRPDFDEFRKIGNILGPFHLAALPIGAYEPNEDLRYQHVKPHEALRMFRDLKAEVAVGVHWGTLRLSAEDFFDPMLDLECALLDVAEEDCRRTTALRHRYKATEVYLRHFRSRHAKHAGNPLRTGSPAPRREKGQGMQGGGDSNRSNSKKGKHGERSAGGGNAHPDHKGEERSNVAGHSGSPPPGLKHNARSRQGGTAFKRPWMLSTDREADKEFENLLQEIQTLMLPMADSVSNASNFQRLLRSLKLQDAGILPNTRAWKDNLLKEGARFQTLFVGQSIQVESSDNNDFIWMTRSSGLQHVLSNAPDEHYTFNPLYVGGGNRTPLHAGFQNVEGFPLYPQLPPLKTSLDDSDMALLM